MHPRVRCAYPGYALIYRAVVRKEIEAGLADSAANRVTPVDEVLREFGIADE